MTADRSRRFPLLGCLLVASGMMLDRAGAAESVLVTGGRWFDTETATFEANQGILIRDGSFVAVNQPFESPPAGALVIRLEDDHHVLPGFIDLHAHYNVSLLHNRREEFRVMPVQYLANGVTVTFSAGEYDPDGMQELREAIEEGRQIGPRLITSGPYFGRARRGWHRDPAKIPAEVAEWAERGVGGFKAKGIDPASLKVLIHFAHEHGLTVTGHLGSGSGRSVNPSDAIDMGIDRVEHFLGGEAMSRDRDAYDTLGSITVEMPEFQAIVEKYVENDVVFVPTITAFGYFGDASDPVFEQWYDEMSLLTDHAREKVADPPLSMERVQIGLMGKKLTDIFRAKQETIDDFWRAGGTVCVGTDLVCRGRFLPGFGYHREMAILARSGIPANEVLKMATINGARALGLEDRHGSIAAGKAGDLVILTGDPSEEISNTQKIEFVVRAGVLHDPMALLEGVKGKLGPTNEKESRVW